MISRVDYSISLFNVEGTSSSSWRYWLEASFMLANKYIDIAVQKGAVAGVSGCVDHTISLTQIICEARENKGASQFCG